MAKNAGKFLIWQIKTNYDPATSLGKSRIHRRSSWKVKARKQLKQIFEQGDTFASLSSNAPSQTLFYHPFRNAKSTKWIEIIFTLASIKSTQVCKFPAFNLRHGNICIRASNSTTTITCGYLECVCLYSYSRWLILRGIALLVTLFGTINGAE